MKEEYTKKDLRKYLTSALKELGAYGFGFSLEIYDAKLSNSEYENYSWNPYLKDNELKSIEYGQDIGLCSFSNKKEIMKYMVEGVVLEIQSYEDYNRWTGGDGICDYFYIELPTKSNPNKKLIKERE